MVLPAPSKKKDKNRYGELLTISASNPGRA